MVSRSSEHVWDPPLFHFAGPSYILQRRSIERSAEGSEYECKDALIHSLPIDEI